MHAFTLQPISGARISFRSAKTGQVFNGVTDDNGLFTFEGFSIDQEGTVVVVQDGFVTFKQFPISADTTESGTSAAIHMSPVLTVCSNSANWD